ncbi:putative reverse transcriptase domain-containing protein, partial [Tanacetum coccineum]
LEEIESSSDFVSPPDIGDDIVHFVLYDLSKPLVPSCSEKFINVDDRVYDLYGDFTLALLDSLFSKGLRIVKSIPPSVVWDFLLLRETLAESSPTLLDDDEDLDLGERNIKKYKRKICDGHYTAAVRVLSSFGVAPYSDATLEDLKTKHPFLPAPSLPHIPIDQHHLIVSSTLDLDRIKSFPRGTSCGRDELRAQPLLDCFSEATIVVFDELISFITQVVNLFLAGNCPYILGEYIASAPFTPLVKLGGGIRPIVVGTIWRHLVSMVSAIMIGHSLNGYLDGLQFGVRVSIGSEAILYAVNRLIKGYRDDVGLSMLLVDFKNAFNLVDREVMLREARLHCHVVSRWVEFCYSNLARLYYEEHTLWSCQGVQQGDPLGPLLFDLVLHPLICKIRDSFSLSLHAWYLDDGTIVGDTLVVGKACSRVFAGDIYGDHVVSCVGIIGIKHHHNVVRDTLVDICYRSGISAAIGYGFLPFSFSSLGELEEDTITLQKLIQKFSMVQDIGAHAVVHIFNMINFTIAKGVGAHIVSQLPSNLL